MKLYYVVNARMPNEKAHGIQIAKMCDAFICAGADVTLVIPGRRNPRLDMRSFYALTSSVSTVRLWVPDFYTSGKLGFFISSLFFMFGYVLFLLRRRVRGERFIIYTIDMDTFSTTLLPLLGTCITEMHTPKKENRAQRLFFNRVRGVVATTTSTKNMLIQTFGIPAERIIVEPNGVDIALFASRVPQDAARRQLSLPLTGKIVLYVGRFYAWKGLDILPVACEKFLAENITCYVVGGTAEELERLSGRALPTNLHCVGAKRVHEIPLWLAASDAAIVLGTAQNEDSFRFTSPMKVFEYLAARVPTVASGTPALKDMLTKDEVAFYEPDNAASLAEQIIRSVTESNENKTRIERAYQKAHLHTWQERAKRILAFCSSLRENTAYGT